MPTARDLLQRFRPVGTPGAAAPAGVPADRAAELGRGLQPIFDELAAADEDADRIRREAEAEAHGRRERAEAEATLLQRAEQESAATVDAAQRDADAITRRAAQRYDELAEAVVRAVRALVPGRTVGMPG